MKLRLLPKVLLLLLLPVCLILAALSLFSYFRADDALRRQVDADMSMLVAQQAREYSKFYENMAAATDMLANRRIVVQAFTQGDLSSLEEAASEFMRVYPDVRHVEFVQPDGKRMFVRGGESFAQFQEQGFLSRLAGGSVATAVFRNPSSKALLCAIGVPVKSTNGGNTFLGAVIVSTPMDVLGAKYSDLIRVGKTGKCFVLDDKGMVLLDPTDKGSIGENISSIDWIRTILNNSKGIVHYAWDGIPKTCFYERIPSMNWVVALGFTDADLLEPLFAMRNFSFILCGAALLLLGGIIVVASRSLTNVLRETADYVREVGSGNMAVPSRLVASCEKASQRYDEIGDMARGIRAMHQHLQEMFTESAASAAKADAAADEARQATSRAEDALRKAQASRHETIVDVTSRLEGITDSLSSTASHLAGQIRQAGHGSEMQADRVAETATAMEEMNATVLEVARNASSASEASIQTRSKAEQGAQVVQQAVKSIQQVQEQSLTLKQDMVALEQNAQAINQIMGVISDIADQTNLLALNAAIEAARAGEAGRGFAVVADEVRKLAEKTMASTTDVGNAIRGIQQSATKSMTQVDEAVRVIGEATRLSSESGTALGEIVHMVDSAVDQVRAIATAAEEQSASSEEINGSIEKVNAIARDNAESMRSAAQQVSMLETQSQELANLINDIKRSQ